MEYKRSIKKLIPKTNLINKKLVKASLDSSDDTTINIYGYPIKPGRNNVKTLMDFKKRFDK